MTICATGVSQRKVGMPRYIILTQGAIADLIGPVAPWLLPFIANGRDIALDLDAFCAADPPGFDTWTSALLIALGLSSSTAVNMAVGAAQLAQWASNIGWYQWCECADATPTVLPAPPAPPADVPTFTPPTPTAQGGYLAAVLADSPLDYWRLADAGYGRCASLGSRRQDLLPVSSNASQAFGFTGPATDGGSILLLGSGLESYQYALPVPMTMECWVWLGSIESTQSIMGAAVIGGAVGLYGQADGTVYLSNSSALSAVVAGPAFQEWHHLAVSITATTATLYLDGVSIASRAGAYSGQTFWVRFGPGTTFNNTMFIAEAALYSAALSAGQLLAHYNAADNTAFRPAVKVPVAPPRVADGLTSDVLQVVTLIQRQGVPFGYVPGTSHAGLTDSGQFAIADLIGLAVDLTDVPAQLGVEVGDPDELFDIGYVTVGTADGWRASVRLAHNPTLILPIDGAQTLVGYTLHAGVVATITELHREP